MTPRSKCCLAPIEPRGSCHCPTCTKCGRRIVATAASTTPAAFDPVYATLQLIAGAK